MGLVITPDSAYGRELWKWEHHTGESVTVGNHTVSGMRANGYQPYPAMLYKVTEKNPWKWEERIAADEVEARNLQSRGFVAGGLQAACDAYEQDRQEVAVQAAARAYTDRNMSDKAKAEVEAAEQEHSGHMAEMPETPIKRSPGRPRKVQ